MMKRTYYYVLIVLIGLILISSVASAIHGKPGTKIPLKLVDFELTTDTPILPDWKPSRVRWELKDPSGETKYFVDSPLDKVEEISGEWFKSTWSITEDSGIMKIPAFATQGEWTVSAVFYHKFLIFTSQTMRTIHVITVEEGELADNVIAPYCFIIKLGFVGSYPFAIDLIYIIAIVVIIPMSYLIYRASKESRRKPHVK